MKNIRSRALFIWLTQRYTRARSGVLGFLGHSTDTPIEIGELRADLAAGRPARRAEQYRQVPLQNTLLEAFSQEPLAAGDKRLIGREQELNRLLAGLDMWRKGRSTTIAVTGRQGSGLTSLLQQLAFHATPEETWHYATLKRRAYNPPDALAMFSELLGCPQVADSMQQLVDSINNLPPRVFVIDNCHFLASRIMGAEAAVRCFGVVVVATQLRHMWVLGCEQYAWQRLDYLYQAKRYFDDCIELQFFNEAELGSCLLERMRAAQLLPVIEPKVAVESTLGGAAESEPEEVPPMLTKVLVDLHKFSGGKPDLAFFYFLDCLTLNEETRQLDTRQVVQLDFSSLKHLVSDDMFTLAEVAVNGELTVADHCAVFRSVNEKSWLLMEHLYHLSLLDKQQDADGITYRISPLYSNVISQYLTNSNYLY